jgi:hypothetical protein
MATATPQTAASRGPNCWQCRFFAVSHVPSAPYACKAMGFQSKVLPALEVLRADGQFCRSFVSKSALSPTGLMA